MKRKLYFTKSRVPCENATLLNIILTIFVIACFFVLIWVLTNQIKDHYSQFDPKLLELCNKLRQYFPDLCNRVSFHEGHDSYTINKKRIYICLKDENGNYYPDNTLYHVLLHELAHVKCDEIGHTELFHEHFQTLLKIAEEKGLYDPFKTIPNNYAKHQNACGR